MAASSPVKKPPFPSGLLAVVQKDVRASSYLDLSTLGFRFKKERELDLLRQLKSAGLEEVASTHTLVLIRQ